MFKLFSFKEKATEPASAEKSHGETNPYIKAGSKQQNSRLVSSIVVSEEFLNPELQSNELIRYVEVPMVEEVVRHIPKQSIVKVRKNVPKYQVEYVDRVVEVPQILYTDNPIEVPIVKDEIKHVRVKQVKEVPVEVIKEVPKVEYRTVERIMQVPGERVEVPKYYPVEKQVEVKHYKDTKLPVVVTQTMQPLVSISKQTIDIPAFQYEPQLIHVDIRVPKPVKTSLIQAGVSEHIPREPVQVPAAQYNSLLKFLNNTLSLEEQELLPYIRENDKVVFLKEGELQPVVVLSTEDVLQRRPQASCWMCERPSLSRFQQFANKVNLKNWENQPQADGKCGKMFKPTCSSFAGLQNFSPFKTTTTKREKRRGFFEC